MLLWILTRTQASQTTQTSFNSTSLPDGPPEVALRSCNWAGVSCAARPEHCACRAGRARRVFKQSLLFWSSLVAAKQIERLHLPQPQVLSCTTELDPGAAWNPTEHLQISEAALPPLNHR